MPFKFNLSAGPGILPREVLQAAAQAVLELDGTGLSLLEVSHRGAEYEPIHRAAQQNLLELLGLSADEYGVLFLGGGASAQFAMLPMNMLPPGGFADYADTGVWASKALKEARLFGDCAAVASSRDRDYSYIPRAFAVRPGAAYFHYTSNNTIYGTAWHTVPEIEGVPLVCDMSSDFLAQPLDFSRFDLIYAGAQKNAGPAGVTVLVVRRAWLERANPKVPSAFSYREHLAADALLNTPPVFSIFVVGEVLKWIRRQGGLPGMEAQNRAKAELLYRSLDSYPNVYRPHVPDTRDRSWMNITFRLRDEGLEKRFLTEAGQLGFYGLKGYRTVGGCRASIYNAFPLEGVQALCSLLEDFAHRNA